MIIVTADGSTGREREGHAALANQIVIEWIDGEKWEGGKERGRGREGNHTARAGSGRGPGLCWKKGRREPDGAGSGQDAQAEAASGFAREPRQGTASARACTGGRCGPDGLAVHWLATRTSQHCYTSHLGFSTKNEDPKGCGLFLLFH